MKKFFLAVIVIIVLSAVLQQFLPWYIIAMVAFAAGYFIKQGLLAAFASGFAAIFLLWTFYAAALSHANGDLLARKVAAVLPFGGHVVILLLVTGVLGGLVSGFASLTGALAASE